jgi:hypothetical protein
MANNDEIERTLEWSGKLLYLTFTFSFVALLFFIAVVNQFGYGTKALEDKTTKTIVEVVKERELGKTFGEVWYHIKEPVKIHHKLTMDNNQYIYIWKPWKDSQAPQKGWLTMENRFYRINVNLDRSYYLLFDKTADKDVLVYDENVEDPLSILTGSDIGFADHGGDKPDFFATTALHDLDGIGRYSIHLEDIEKGIIFVALEGWDYQPNDSIRGYDIEAEVLLGLFADKPYFIDATEVNNLQKMGYKENIPNKDPDEVVKSWVVIGDYDSAVIKGGDLDHFNAELWRPWYEVKTINDKGRKPWHFGSAQFSKMFPTHKLIGQTKDGGIIFSLPEGKFRYDESQGIYGDQVVGEFLLVVQKPKRAHAFSVEPVNEYDFFYDSESYVERHRESMVRICVKYDLSCPDQPLDWHNWETKRFAYVITLVSDWYNPETNQPYDRIWNQSDKGLEDFKLYESIIVDQMKKTRPLAERR